MLFSYYKVWRIDKLSYMMFAGHDGRTINEEHQRQQRRHTYGPPCDWYARFAMPAMLGASATDCRWLIISSPNSGGPGDFNTGIFALYLSGNTVNSVA